ncbi:citrate/2-methylcitrate synthase, partial [Streptomyces bobili]|uniref:citrate/2-methylcitrate synthase n=1 Tax=Streptomyces bobili TaxID=67280 RepID=UPI00342CBEF5
MSVNRSAATLVEVPRGLAGVVVADTEVGDVRGREGFYHYRQYSAVDLAHSRPFEDVWHLLVHADLPDAPRAAAFAAE